MWPFKFWTKTLSEELDQLRLRYWEWNQAWDINVFIRYFPAEQFISKSRLGKHALILDVGSGPRGISQFLKNGTIIGLDLFEGTETFDSSLCPVTGAASSVPFPDKIFDHVVCIDVLEHIPSEQRKKIISELLRVMRHDLVLGVPCGSAAEEKDMQSYRATQNNGYPNRWLEEHIREGLPSEEFIDSVILEDKSVKVLKKIACDNIALIQIRDWFGESIFRRFRRILLFFMVIAPFIRWGKCYRTYWFVGRSSA